MKKSPWTRQTAASPFTELHPKFLRYMQCYCESHQIENIGREVQHCFVTTNRKRGLFGQVKTNYTVVCITEQFLFWGIIHDRKETGIAAAKWGELSEIHDWEATEGGKIFEDQGVELFGFIYRRSNRSRWFIGLSHNEAGNQCRTLLKSRCQETVDSKQ